MSREKLSLNGEWRLLFEGKAYKGEVPGCLHTDLLNASVIKDPFKGLNEKELEYLGEAGCSYTKLFLLDKAVCEREYVILSCHGLDTFAAIYLNGHLIAKTNNMHMKYEINIKDYIVVGENELKIDFESTIPYIKEKQSKDGYLYSSSKLSFGYVRKAFYQYGWDWAPALITCGIWRDMEIIAYDHARMIDMEVQQEHRNGNINLDVTVKVDGLGNASKMIQLTLKKGDAVVNVSTISVQDGRFHANLSVDHPQLWWPNGYGEQHLYNICAELVDEKGGLLDCAEQRIGLREVELVREKDAFGESFYFRVNGLPIFMKGANWVPLDSFPSRVTDKKYEFAIDSIQQCHFNMLRIWGGGIYEKDIFYDLCDEKGILIWHDFMVACTHVPIQDKEFTHLLTEESRQQVIRLRNRPSIALWCGNNEYEMNGIAWDGQEDRMNASAYKELFDGRFSEMVATEHPGGIYWPCSPHTPNGDRDYYNNETCGDVHLWEVWGYKEMPRDYLNQTARFVSEFGMQSLPHPDTIAYYMGEGGLGHCTLQNETVLSHQKDPGGNDKLEMYLKEHFDMGNDFEETTWKTQIVQALGIKSAVEHYRRNQPRTMGALYWMLGDCWPAASWSSIDYFGNWKALQYFSRRFFSPVLVSGVLNHKKDVVTIYLARDAMRENEVEIEWSLETFDGRIIKSDTIVTEPSIHLSKIVQALKLTRQVEEYGEKNLVLFLRARVDGKVVSSNYVCFSEDIKVLKAGGVAVSDLRAVDGRSFILTLRANEPSLHVFIALKGIDAQISDNFFCMGSQEEYQISIKTKQCCSVKELREKMQICRSELR